MTQQTTMSNTGITLEGERDIVISREFAAPADLVFRAWTEPEYIKQWWGPPTWPTVKCTVDLRVGGLWHYCMRGPDGEESWGAAVYKEIEAPKRLVCEDHFSDAEATLTPPPIGNVLELHALGANRTRSVCRTTFASAEHRKELTEMGMLEGIQQGLEQMTELLSRDMGRTG